MNLCLRFLFAHSVYSHYQYQRWHWLLMKCTLAGRLFFSKYQLLGLQIVIDQQIPCLKLFLQHLVFVDFLLNQWVANCCEPVSENYCNARHRYSINQLSIQLSKKNALEFKKKNNFLRSKFVFWKKYIGYFDRLSRFCIMWFRFRRKSPVHIIPNRPIIDFHRSRLNESSNPRYMSILKINSSWVRLIVYIYLLNNNITTKLTSHQQCKVLELGEL